MLNLLRNTVVNYSSGVLLFCMSRSDSTLWHAVSFLVLYDLYRLSIDKTVEFMASFYTLEENFNVDLAYTDVSTLVSIGMCVCYVLFFI